MEAPNWTVAKIPPLLNGRLTPGQREDYKLTRSFCVRGSNRRLYRIDAGARSDQHDHLYRVVDQKGWRRGFWFYSSDSDRAARSTLDDEDMVLALMLFLQARADVFEMEACVGDQLNLNPCTCPLCEARNRLPLRVTDYEGEI
jgi:hypothetical protein